LGVAVDWLSVHIVVDTIVYKFNIEAAVVVVVVDIDIIVTV